MSTLLWWYFIAEIGAIIFVLFVYSLLDVLLDFLTDFFS